MNTASFLDNTLLEMEDHKTVSGAIAKAVQATDHPNPLNRIAMAWDAQRQARKNANIIAVRTGVPAQELDWKPERMLSFIQQLMNQIGWSARRVLKTNNTADLANGIDFSQDVAEQAANLESASRDNVVSTYEDDFSGLLQVHSWLASNMSYLTEVNDLYFYAESKNVAEEGEPPHYELVQSLMEFDDVMAHLDNKAELLAEEAEGKISEEAATMDFSQVSTKAA